MRRQAEGKGVSLLIVLLVTIFLLAGISGILFLLQSADKDSDGQYSGASYVYEVPSGVISDRS